MQRWGGGETKAVVSDLVFSNVCVTEQVVKVVCVTKQVVDFCTHRRCLVVVVVVLGGGDTTGGLHSGTYLKGCC